MCKSVYGRARYLLLLTIVAGLLIAVAAASASAAPGSGTMSLAELQSKLDATGGAPLQGYLKTVLRGSTITRIPVDVLAVTYGAYPGTSLIMFEATGPDIDRIGGIASGMSGSPLYVEGRMIGALSYGDIFTLRGTGLATPIEYMTAIEDDFSTSAQSLDRPVISSSGVVRDVVVTNEPEKYSGLSAAGTLVMSPLASVRIGGPGSGTQSYNRLKAAYEKAGLSVQSGQSVLAGEAMVNGTLFNAPFEDGSAIAVLEARGDVWAGGIGTVTYANQGRVLAFGHPYANMGNTDWYMLNAWIDGVWPSSISPYKYGRPGAVRGRIVRDKWSGIMGTTGAAPAESPVTSTARSADSGKVASATSYVTKYAFEQPWGSDLAAYAVNMASYRLADLSYSMSGSADATTTIVVSDGTTTHTIKTHDVFDSLDVGWEAAFEVYGILDKLRTVTAYGLEKPEIVSVSQDAVFAKRRRSATVVDIQAPNGLAVGDNRVVVSLLVYGVAETQTVETTVSVPEGTSLTGQLTCGVSFDPGTFYYGDGGYMYLDGTTERKSIAELVDTINRSNPNNVLTVKYVPVAASEKEMVSPAATVVGTATTDWVIGGYITKSTATLDANLNPEVIAYDGYASVSGVVQGPIGAQVEIWGTPAGEATQSLLATAKQSMSGETFGFDTLVGPLRKNTSLQLVFPGDKSYLAAVSELDVDVRARVRLTTSASRVKRGTRVTLSALTNPRETAGDRVALQRWDGASRSWRTVQTKSLSVGGSGAKVTFTYRAMTSVKLRAKYLGGESNRASVSPSVTIRTR